MVAIMNLERKLAALGVPNPASVNINSTPALPCSRHTSDRSGLTPAAPS